MLCKDSIITSLGTISYLSYKLNIMQIIMLNKIYLNLFICTHFTLTFQEKKEKLRCVANQSFPFGNDTTTPRPIINIFRSCKHSSRSANQTLAFQAVIQPSSHQICFFELVRNMVLYFKTSVYKTLCVPLGYPIPFRAL